MTTTEWVPKRVQRIDRELIHEEQRLPGLEREVAECKERISILKREREEELKHGGLGP